jgi:hypothetical protein
MKTAKDWFEEELSGEPLTQESVIEVLEMVQKETWNEALDKAAESAELVECDPMEFYVDKQSILKLKV